MNIIDKNVGKLSSLVLVIILCILAFFVVKPILIAVLTGLILAYIFTPAYKRSNKYIKNRSLSALVISLLIIIIIFVPLWFIFPLIIQQTYEVFTSYQTIDVHTIVTSFFPTASERFISQASLTLNNLVSSVTLYVSQTLINFILNVPYLVIDLFIIAFVFFYGLRDGDKLKEFVKAVSPLNETHEKTLVSHFKSMTETIIYGQFIVGIIQGLCAGIGFALFGVQNSLILTILAMFFSIIPFIGPSIIWGPVNIYFFATGQVGFGIAYLFYNLLVVSLVDNMIRSYLISRKTSISPAIVIVGMIGGVYMFNVIGLILGPLILAYLIAVLESFKDKKAYSIFSNSE